MTCGTTRRLVTLWYTQSWASTHMHALHHSPSFTAAHTHTELVMDIMILLMLLYGNIVNKCECDWVFFLLPLSNSWKKLLVQLCFWPAIKNSQTLIFYLIISEFCLYVGFTLWIVHLHRRRNMRSKQQFKTQTGELLMVQTFTDTDSF